MERIPSSQQTEEAYRQDDKTVICNLPYNRLHHDGCVSMLPDSNDQGASAEPTSGAYNLYPPGILPSDLGSEIQRVREEVRHIESEAISPWKALPAPVVTGQPPLLQNTGTAAIDILGKPMNFDENMSPNNNRAGAFCHRAMRFIVRLNPMPLASPRTLMASATAICD